jgi:hypothetical protein
MSFPFVRPGCILLTGEVHDSGSEEAEGVIVMISDWLELDATDSWVRHDSEIVSVPLRHVLNFGGRRRVFFVIRPHLTPHSRAIMTVCRLTRPCSRSCPLRHTWTCRLLSFHPPAIVIRLRRTGVPSTVALRGHHTCNFPFGFPSMTHPSFKAAHLHAPHPGHRVTNFPPPLHLLPYHRLRFAQRSPGRHQRRRRRLS